MERRTRRSGDKRAMQLIRAQCETAKRALSSATSASSSGGVSFSNFQLELLESGARDSTGLDSRARR